MKHTRLPLIYVPSILLAGFGGVLLALFLAISAIPVPVPCHVGPGPACTGLPLATETAIVRLSFATLLGTIALFASSAAAAVLARRHGRGPDPSASPAASRTLRSTQEPVRQS